ncbi:MAG TPA: tetratricopeptide repeat protein [Candidatus Dormibacteraeota bacterium]|nr:tetratricopeptide repeat protein [Candidatus Dormibacteraeota bacterium]
MICPHCQTPNPAGAQNCSECGSGIVSLEEGATLEHLDSTSIPAGEDFGPRYRVESLLGAGGMGKVYKAHDKELDRTVALKVLRPDLMADPTALQRFKQELLLASKISHPNILRIHDLGEFAGVKFISMAYVEGGDLHQILKQEGRLPPQRAVRLMEQLCEALAAAHDANVMHRDLKPQNVLIDRKDRVYVSDFGLAKTLEANLTGMTRAGAVLGTPLYMSPEQVEGKPVDQRSDIYALGLVLYEMLTGVLPFQGDSTYQVMYQRVHQFPKKPELLNPDLPPYLSRICLRCLDKDPAMRYQNAREILADLRSGVASSGPRGKWIAGRTVKRVGWALAASLVILTILVVTVPAIKRELARRNSAISIQKSLAIMPFQIEAPVEKSTVTYEAQGIAEALSAKLSQMKGLRLVPASSLERTSKDPPKEVARAAGADLMLAATMGQRGEKRWLRVELTELKTGRTAWSEEFSWVPQDLLTLEDQVYNKLLSALALKPSNEELARGATRPTENIEAYDLYLRGGAAIRNQRTVETLQTAISFYEQALKKDPSFALAYSGLSDAYIYMYERNKDSSLPGKALGAALQAQQFGENRPEVHFSLGSVYRVTGKTSESIAEFKRALELAPNSDEGYRRLGSAYKAAGRKQEALMAYERAIAINPYLWLNYSQLGTAALQFGDNTKALAAFQRVTELNPKSSTGYNNIGIVYYRQGKWDASVPAFQKALEIEPTSAVYSNLGTAYFYLRRYDDAVRMFEKSVELNPASEAQLGNLADAYRWSGQREKASATYEKAIGLAYKEFQVNSRDAVTLGHLALYYAKKGDTARGLEFIRRALAIDPNDVGLFDKQAVIYALAGRTAESLTSLHEALQRGYPLEEVKNDPELKTIQALPDFAKLAAIKPEAKKN